MDENNGFLSCKDLAKCLSVSTWTIYGWVGQRRIPYFKVGRLVRFNKAQVLSWIEKQRFEPLTKFWPANYGHIS